MIQTVSMAGNKWIQHYIEWRKTHPEECKGMSVKECVAEARKSYTPVERPPKSTEKKPHPWLTHYRQWMADNPEKFKELGVAGSAQEARKSYKIFGP